jgi:hypothetical protein
MAFWLLSLETLPNHSKNFGKVFLHESPAKQG